MTQDQTKFFFVGLGNIGCQAVHKAVTTVAEAYSASVRGLLLDTALTIKSFGQLAPQLSHDFRARQRLIRF